MTNPIPSDPGSRKRLDLVSQMTNRATARQDRSDIPVPSATVRSRHRFIGYSFVAVVIIPFFLSTAYLFAVAKDQYASNVSFSIRSEEVASAAAGILGAITQINSGTANDAEILYDFILSQDMVEAVDRKLDLRRLYSKPSWDPVFTVATDATVEDLIDYWHRMVRIDYDTTAGIISVQTRAFTADDALSVTSAILAESADLVNRLSEQARRDAIRYSLEDLREAESNLRDLRQKLARFRRENKMVDPEADIAGQMGLLSALQSELAQALVERDTLLSYADQGDQRVIQSNRRIDAIRARIEEERNNLGIVGPDTAPAELLGQYEELLVDLEFASAAYTQALTNVAVARAEARRQTRYLAAHVQPTRAEDALYPRRFMLSGILALFLVVGWGIGVTLFYNIRDRR